MFPTSNEIQKMRKKYNLQMYQSGINTFREIGRVETNALKDGVLAQKYKELIALGISISNKCYGWIEYHVSRAADAGTSRDEILEATAVAVALGGGMADWPARFVFKVLEELESKQKKAKNKAS